MCIRDRIVSVDKNGEAQASDYVSFDIMKEEDVKKFGAVKVVENYLPTSITFWAEVHYLNVDIGPISNEMCIRDRNN